MKSVFKAMVVLVLVSAAGLGVVLVGTIGIVGAAGAITAQRVPDPVPTPLIAKLILLDSADDLALRIASAQADDSCSTLLDYCVQIHCELENRSTATALPLVQFEMDTLNRREELTLKPGERRRFTTAFHDATIGRALSGSGRGGCSVVGGKVPGRLGCTVTNPTEKAESGWVTFDGNPPVQVHLVPGMNELIKGPWLHAEDASPTCAVTRDRPPQ